MAKLSADDPLLLVQRSFYTMTPRRRKKAINELEEAVKLRTLTTQFKREKDAKNRVRFYE